MTAECQIPFSCLLRTGVACQLTSTRKVGLQLGGPTRSSSSTERRRTSWAVSPASRSGAARCARIAAAVRLGVTISVTFFFGAAPRTPETHRAGVLARLGRGVRRSPESSLLEVQLASQARQPAAGPIPDPPVLLDDAVLADQVEAVCPLHAAGAGKACPASNDLAVNVEDGVRCRTPSSRDVGLGRVPVAAASTEPKARSSPLQRPAHSN